MQANFENRMTVKTMEIIGLKEFIFALLKLIAIFIPIVLMVLDISPVESICNFFKQLKNHHKSIETIEPPYGLQPFLGVDRSSPYDLCEWDNGFFNSDVYNSNKPYKTNGLNK